VGNLPLFPVNKIVEIVLPASEHQRLHRLFGTFWWSGCIAMLLFVCDVLGVLGVLEVLFFNLHLLHPPFFQR